MTATNYQKPDQTPLIQRVRYVLPLIVSAAAFCFCLAVEWGTIFMGEDAREQFYATFGTASYYTCILLNTVYCRNYGLGWIKSFVFSFLSFQLVFNFVSVTWADLDVLLFGSGTIASFRSAMLLPLLCMPLSRFCKVDTLNLCDCLTPYFFLHHGVVTVACWIQGCCGGKTWRWGLRNPLSGRTVFPTQPCIIVLSIAVAYWGLCYSRKHDYKSNGMVFANSLIIYGFFRYLIELFSDDPRALWVLSWLSICSLAMIAQGFFIRYAVEKQQKNTIQR